MARLSASVLQMVDENNPFLNYKGKVKIVDREFLSEDELNKLEKKTFATERLAQVRDIFLFCCYIGLAYSDVKKLSQDLVRKGHYGECWIFANRKKTDVLSAVPLLFPALRLIEKYKEYLPCLLGTGKSLCFAT